MAVKEKILAWDVTVVCQLVQSYVSRHMTPGAAAELPAKRKSDKQKNFPKSYLFCPMTVETKPYLRREIRVTPSNPRVIHRSGLRVSYCCFRAFSVSFQRFNSLFRERVSWWKFEKVTNATNIYIWFLVLRISVGK